MSEADDARAEVEPRARVLHDAVLVELDVRPSIERDVHRHRPGRVTEARQHVGDGQLREHHRQRVLAGGGVDVAVDARGPTAAVAGGGEVHRQRRRSAIDRDAEVGVGEAPLLPAGRVPHLDRRIDQRQPLESGFDRRVDRRLDATIDDLQRAEEVREPAARGTACRGPWRRGVDRIGVTEPHAAVGRADERDLRAAQFDLPDIDAESEQRQRIDGEPSRGHVRDDLVAVVAHVDIVHANDQPEDRVDIDDRPCDVHRIVAPETTLDRRRDASADETEFGRPHEDDHHRADHRHDQQKHRHRRGPHAEANHGRTRRALPERPCGQRRAQPVEPRLVHLQHAAVLSAKVRAMRWFLAIGTVTVASTSTSGGLAGGDTNDFGSTQQPDIRKIKPATLLME